MKKFLLSQLLILPALFLCGQGSGLPLESPTYHILDRLEIKTGIPAPFHSSLKYYTRGDVGKYAMAVDTARVPLSGRDRQDLYYIFKDNNEWLEQPRFYTTVGGKRERIDPETELTQVEASMENPRYILSKKPVLKIFYPTPANFLELNKKYIHLRVNPILNFKLAEARDDDQLVFTNQRGVELRGGVDDRIYFYFNLLETQARFPDYVNDRIDRDEAIPGAGLFKPYKSTVFDIERGYDFLNGQGYFGFNVTRHVGVQFGYGRNFIGNGYRSLLLSDFANNYLYLKLNWTVWKLHYQNLFTEMTTRSDFSSVGEVVLPKKYMAAHHLSINVLPNLNFGIFEAVVFSRTDRFEFHYLNPIILLRTVEQATGSPDNVLMGIDAKWNFLKRFQLYGQLMIDEFVFKELFLENQGWWANKYGFQAGLKYIDAFGVDHLDLQAEINNVRPYAYTHHDSSANYSHYSQPLAHPLGANFREMLFIARYQPFKKLFIDARLIRAEFGEDAPETNWGGNILLPNVVRERDYDNVVAQGVKATTTLFGLDVSYMLAHNVFLDLHYFHRKKDSEDAARSKTTQYIGGGVRVNIGKQRMDF
jgi:hypothetical protein